MNLRTVTAADLARLKSPTGLVWLLFHWATHQTFAVPAEEDSKATTVEMFDGLRFNLSNGYLIDLEEPLEHIARLLRASAAKDMSLPGRVAEINADEPAFD